MKKVEKIIQSIVNVFFVISLVAIVFCLSGFLQLKVLKKPYIDIFGYTFFSVATGSMQPTLAVHDIIIVKITDDVQVGDIITYRAENDFITHRVISNNKDTFITKGDYNNTEDNPIDLSNVVGKMVCKLPNLGVIGDVLLTPKVFVSLVVTLFLFSLCFSYVPKEEKVTAKNLDKNNKKKILSLFSKKDEKNKDNKDEVEVKIIQDSKDSNNIEELIHDLDYLNKKSKKKVDLGETAELFLNLKELEKEKVKIKEKLEKKNKINTDNIKNKKKKIDLDETCEFVLSLDNKKKKNK